MVRRKKTPFRVGDRVVRNKAVGSVGLPGDVAGTIVKVTDVASGAGGTRARIRVRWDNGHEASVEDRQLLLVQPRGSVMTKHQAWHAAQQRWSSRGEFGSSAQVCLRTKKFANRCLVGYLLWKDAARRTCNPLLIGEGPTWEDAFANADDREARGLPPLREGFL